MMFKALAFQIDKMYKIVIYRKVVYCMVKINLITHTNYPSC